MSPYMKAYEAGIKLAQLEWFSKRATEEEDRTDPMFYDVDQVADIQDTVGEMQKLKSNIDYMNKLKMRSNKEHDYTSAGDMGNQARALQADYAELRESLPENYEKQLRNARFATMENNYEGRGQEAYDRAQADRLATEARESVTAGSMPQEEPIMSASQEEPTPAPAAPAGADESHQELMNILAKNVDQPGQSLQGGARQSVIPQAPQPELVEGEYEFPARHITNSTSATAPAGPPAPRFDYMAQNQEGMAEPDARFNVQAGNYRKQFNRFREQFGGANAPEAFQGLNYRDFAGALGNRGLRVGDSLGASDIMARLQQTRQDNWNRENNMPLANRGSGAGLNPLDIQNRRGNVANRGSLAAMNAAATRRRQQQQREEQQQQQPPQAPAPAPAPARAAKSESYISPATQTVFNQRDNIVNSRSGQDFRPQDFRAVKDLNTQLPALRRQDFTRGLNPNVTNPVVKPINFKSPATGNGSTPSPRPVQVANTVPPNATSGTYKSRDGKGNTTTTTLNGMTKQEGNNLINSMQNTLKGRR